MDKLSLGNRMKRYEITSQLLLPRFIPAIVRVDGRHFHTFTQELQKPFDQNLINVMWNTGIYLCDNIQGCKMAYIQSDEISLLLTDYETIKTQAFFDYNVQKCVSTIASAATVGFNKSWNSWIRSNGWAEFDARIWSLPKEEVCNYMIWRQKDWERNSIQGLAQANFSHKQLHGKNCNQLQEMLFQEKDINWNDCLTYQKRGVCIIKKEYKVNEVVRSKWIVDEEIPIFTQDRNYIEKYI